MVLITLLVILFACWGSFLNVIAYRLVRGISIISKRSSCPYCHTVIAWYDLIPIISWFLLQGICRTCKHPISFLYPSIEIISASTLTILALFTPSSYFTGYFIFFSALIITIRSDIEYMLISRFVTLYLIPIAWLLIVFNMLPLTFFASLFGAIGGYLFLYSIAYIFQLITHKEGMGEGDFDLLALIGAFTGPIGCWTSILIGSIVGSCIGITYMLVYKPSEPIKIPFGPFLVLGAMTYIFLTIIHF